MPSAGNRSARRISALDRKLMRDLWRIKGQALAIVLVIASGIALLVMARGMMASLSETMIAYYDRAQFADLYAPVKRAPGVVLADVRALPGVADAEARISGAGLVDLSGVAAPISARILSIDPTARRRINDLHLAAGRMIDPARSDEVLLLQPFADAYGLAPGDTISVTMYGARHEFKVAGIALSPEFIYTIAPGEFVSDPKRFAVIWASAEALGAAFDLDGAFNEVILTSARNANLAALEAALDRLLAPYGALGAYPRADQISNKYLVEELDQLATMTRVMTPIFLGVSIFLLNIVITRLVQTERDQIGLMKAFGYEDREVALHYLKFAGVIGVGGALVGWSGGMWLARMISDIYATYFHFPFLVYVPEVRALGLALIVSIASALAGAAFAVNAAARLLPAEAMRPPAPPKYRRAGPLLRGLERRLDQPSRMILRRITRQPVRAGLTTLGVGAAMALSVMMRFNANAVDQMLDQSFNVVDRSDVLVSFAEPLSQTALFELSRLEGVTFVEPARAAPAMFSNGARHFLGAVTGLPPSPALNRAIDSDMHAFDVSGTGLVVSSHLANKLGVGPGDTIRVEVREGRRPAFDARVSGVIEALVGTPVFMATDALNTALKEPDRVSGAYLKIDPLRREAIYEALKAMPKVAGVSLRLEAYATFERMLEEGPGTFRRIMTIFSIVIAAGVVYNSARIAYFERRHDLASLRVLGFTRSETGYVLLGELAVLTLAAIPVGSALGYALWRYISAALSTDLYRIPVVYREDGLGFAAIVVIVASVAAGAFVQRDVSRLDMATALKTRE